MGLVAAVALSVRVAVAVDADKFNLKYFEFGKGGVGNYTALFNFMLAKPETFRS